MPKYAPGERSTDTADADIDVRRYDSLSRVLDIHIKGGANPVVTAVTLYNDKILIAANTMNPVALKELDRRVQIICSTLQGHISASDAAKSLAPKSRSRDTDLVKDLRKLRDTYNGVDTSSPELQEKLRVCVAKGLQYENATRQNSKAVSHAEQDVVFYLMKDDSVHTYDYTAGISKLCCKTCDEFLTQMGVTHRGTHGGIYPNVLDPQTGDGLPKDVYETMQDRGNVNPLPSPSASEPYNSSQYNSLTSDTDSRSRGEQENDAHLFALCRRDLKKTDYEDKLYKYYRNKGYEKKAAKELTRADFNEAVAQRVFEYKQDLARATDVGALATSIGNMGIGPSRAEYQTYSTTHTTAPGFGTTQGYGGGQPTEYQYEDPLTGRTFSAAASRGEVPTHRPGVSHPQSFDHGYETTSPTHSNHHTIR
jgi:hypothetical protein